MDQYTSLSLLDADIRDRVSRLDADAEPALLWGHDDPRARDARWVDAARAALPHGWRLATDDRGTVAVPPAEDRW